MVLELVLLAPGALKTSVMLVATLWARSVKVATPSVVVAVSVPCRVPLPLPRAAVTTVLLVTPLAALRRLPNWSRTWRTGCCAKGTPAVAVAEGCVRMARLLAAPATSRKVPRLALVERPTTLAVPLIRRNPLTNGVPAVGRTRTFCQVNVQRAPALLGTVTVKVSCVALTEVIASEVPLLAPLIFLEAELAEVSLTVGAVPLVSKTNPVGALTIMVPV